MRRTKTWGNKERIYYTLYTLRGGGETDGTTDKPLRCQRHRNILLLLCLYKYIKMYAYRESKRETKTERETERERNRETERERGMERKRQRRDRLRQRHRNRGLELENFNTQRQ